MNFSTVRAWVFIGVGLLACSSSDQGRNTKLGGGIASQQSALTGSQNLLAALSGKIIAPPSGPISSGMPGDPSVGDDGAASYRIPIWVPDGVNGLQPALALEYNSEAATGLLGPRWRLTGLSTITRCPKTRAQDGVQTAVDFFGSTFCLDGQRMIVVGTIDATRTEFRTERDTYVKIVGVKDTTLNQYYQFTAYQKDGLISSFGTTALSRLHGNPHSWAGGSQADVNYAYYVDKIQDRYGNAINITYRNGIASPPPFGASGKTEVQELQPLTITWGLSSERSVTFDYEGIPGALNPQVRYVSGLGIGMATYMKTILVKGPDGMDAPPPVLKQYKLTYDTNAQPAVGPPLTIITGDRVLSTITECDGTSPTPICKKPTKLQWSAGSTGYTTVDLSAGIPDFSAVRSDLWRVIGADLNSDGRDDVVYRAWVPPHHVDQATDCAGWQARLTSIDASNNPAFGSATALPLNADPDPSCLAHVISSTEWENYREYVKGAFPGDVLFVDLNGDGLPDILSPIGQKHQQDSGGTQPPLYPVADPIMVGYRAYLNQGGTSLAFGLPANFLDSIGQEPSNNQGYNTLFPNPKHAALSVGDIDGDGLLDVIRPNENPPQHLSAATIVSSALTAKTQTRNGYTFNYSECATATAGCNKTIANVLFPDNSTTFSDVSAVDLDGDGRVELVRTATSCAGLPCGNWNGIAAVTSPTVNNIIINFPPAGKSTLYDQTRWFLDLNGDGLQDMVWLNTKLQSPNNWTDEDRLSQKVVWAAINTGQGFGPPKTTNLSYLWATHGPLVMDYNLDGRQDLLVKVGEREVDPTTGLRPKDPYLMALISDGKGGFVELVTALPTPRYTETQYNTNYYPYSMYRYQLQAAVLDLNGDGLPDTVHNDAGTDGTWSVQQAHMHAGTAPMLLLGAYEGNGRVVSFTYAPATNDDPSFYSSDRSRSCGTDPTHLDCLNHGRWLAKSVTTSSFDTDGGQVIQPITQTFGYLDGVSDQHGRGFLGFKQRYIYGPGSRKTTITYDPLTRQANGNKYVYPYAMQPTLLRVDADTPHGPNSHSRTEHSTTYTPPGSVWQSNGTYAVLPVSGRTILYDCLPSNPLGTCGGTPHILGYQTTSYTNDSYGNLTNRTVKFYDTNNTLLRTDTDDDRFQAADLESWLVALPDPTNPNTQKSVVGTETVTRTVKITPDMTVNGVTGLRVGLVQSIEFEPNGTSDVRLRRTFGRSPTTGQVTSVSDAAVGSSSSACTSSCSGSCTPQCQEGCTAGPGQAACMTSCMNSCMNPCVQTCMAPGEVRTTNFSYDDGSDGVYVNTTTDPMGHTTKVWRHPGYGVVVESDDQNNLSATTSYDTFGRPLSQTAISGVTTTFSYPASSANGMDVLIKPENLATRQVRVHYDSWGRELTRTSPIDATGTLTTTTHYDNFGRVSFTDYRGPTLSTVLNTYVNTYDDLNRLWRVCHQVSDGTTQCRTNTFDGLTTRTTNESGRQTTSIADAMGQVATQQASVSGGTSDATYTYGAFGVLKRQEVSDGSGATDIVYDVLGRPVRTTRTNAGIRATTYNAFGESIDTYKVASDGARVEKMFFGRDTLGRLTSVTGSGMNRAFYWDAPLSSPGIPAPNAKGKLVDVTDTLTTGQTIQVHYDYLPNGLLSKKTWSGTVWSQFTASASYEYDQGRLSKLTYPKVESWSRPLELLYGYDPYLGDVSTITDASNPTTPVWSVLFRDYRGQVTGERMHAPSTDFYRWPSYYSTTGLLSAVYYDQTVAASGSYTWGTVGYQYDGAGLPSGSQQAGDGVVDAWRSSFAYDNLGRLTRWGTGQCCGGFNTGVDYSYDGDGNMTQRQWAHPAVAGSLQYGISPNAGGTYTRTVRYNRTRFPSVTDNYQADAWGRIFSTPAAWLTYNAADEVTAVGESNGQTDYILRDGFGGRVATTYSHPQAGPNWSLLFTFDDLAEIRETSSGFEERCRLRANGKLIGELVRTSNTPARSAKFYVTDIVGSIVAESSAEGVTARARRDPFGNLVPDATMPEVPPDPTTANQDANVSGRLGFGDHPRDNNWGLVNMNARFYSPRLGRFISPDSVIGNALDRRAYNPFAYAWNNPVGMNDPSGHYPGECDDCGTRDDGDGTVSPPTGGGYGPGSTPSGSELPLSAGVTPGRAPNNTYISLTGTVPLGVQTTTNSANSSSNYALRTHGPTDGNRQDVSRAGEPWSCGGKAADALRAEADAARAKEDARDELAIHAYLMGHSEEYLRQDREQRQIDGFAGTNGGMGTRSFAEDIGEGLLTLGGSVAFRVVARTALAARGGAAALESSALRSSTSRAPLGQVPGLQAGEGAAAGGSRIHLDIGFKMQGRYGGDWSGVLPGRNGPDWIPSQGTNATFGEIKSIWTAPGKITGQASKWGITGENISQGRYFFYDPATGNFWEGIIAP